jgi:hypothetical protein
MCKCVPALLSPEMAAVLLRGITRVPPPIARGITGLQSLSMLTPAPLAILLVIHLGSQVQVLFKCHLLTLLKISITVQSLLPCSIILFSHNT